MNELKYRRKNRKHSTILALTQAQKLAFAPLTFQAIGTMIDFGMLQMLDEKPCRPKDLVRELNLNEYTVNTLLEIAETANIAEQNIDGNFSATAVAKAFLYDEMTKVNFNFVREVCYLGASEMTKSFLNEKPEGLHKFFGNTRTIYPLVPKLPEKVRKSWYEFDHYYSDNCYDIIYKIIAAENPKRIFDIGANTGKFEKTCLKYNPNIDITMLDLQENIEIVSRDKELQTCKFHAIDVLDETQKFPQLSGAVFMSQFLDCFAKQQIISILTRISENSEENTLVYILEPFTDNQQFEGARYSLVHTSLYFTCMANGNSKMYKQTEMEEMIEQSGLKLKNTYTGIGAHDYTLLECVKK